MVDVEIVRSWSDGSGSIYSHMGGFYGYKNGDPVRDEAEFRIISDPVHYKSAMSWWNRVGKKESVVFYAQKSAEHEAALGDFNPEATTDSEMDHIGYVRYPSGTEKDDKSEPAPWREFFPERPDWWGLANIIEFQDWIYARYDPDKKPKVLPKTKKEDDSTADISKDSTAQPPGEVDSAGTNSTGVANTISTGAANTILTGATGKNPVSEDLKTSGGDKKNKEF